MCKAMNDFEQLTGTWKNSTPWESDDYLSEYVISGSESKPCVTGKDLNDGEEFKITNVVWSNNELCFESYMPSTKRKGINKFSLGLSGNIISEFTFTVVEELTRGHT